MKQLIFALALLPFAAQGAENPPYEVCTYEGPCAIRAYDQANGVEVWLASPEGLDLSTVWTGTWYQVDEELYQRLSAEIPEENHWQVPAINPTTGMEMRKGGGGKSTPPPKGGGQSSGPLIQVGDITVGGSNPCAPCHGSDMKEIHKPKKDDK